MWPSQHLRIVHESHIHIIKKRMLQIFDWISESPPTRSEKSRGWGESDQNNQYDCFDFHRGTLSKFGEDILPKPSFGLIWSYLSRQMELCRVLGHWKCARELSRLLKSFLTSFANIWALVWSKNLSKSVVSQCRGCFCAKSVNFGFGLVTTTLRTTVVGIRLPI